MFPFSLRKHFFFLKKYFRAGIEVRSKIRIRLCRDHTLWPILYNTRMYRQTVLQLPDIKHRRIRPVVLKLLREWVQNKWKELSE